MNKAEDAVTCFEKDFSCAQAVCSTYGPQLGLNRELALKIAGAFGGGMACLGQTCGAVTGALMIIGLRYGKTEAGNDEAKERTYSLAQEFADRFQARHGSIVCQELLGCDIGTPEGKEFASAQGLFDTLCSTFVRDAAEILEEMGIAE